MILALLANTAATPTLQQRYFEGVEGEKHHYQCEGGCQSKTVLGTETFVEGNEETSADKTEDVERIEARIVAEADVVDDLRK